ncbi:hypothetical protein PCL_12255 [Purpureocillium lilacinum]|uniref:Uncharacterized protein n=1 Tax=Purpureocillium lilacinum TaxID=33203 RepID=A0A2U3E8S9_PURLI|nr:hypothetical protein PCL_12255 [Purpureocillium lilacinum]
MAWPGTARTTEQFASHLARPKNRCQRSALPSRRLKRSAWDDAYVLAFPTVRAAEGLACKPRPACREPVPLARGPSQVPVIFIWWHHGQPARHEPLQRDARPSGTNTAYAHARACLVRRASGAAARLLTVFGCHDPTSRPSPFAIKSQRALMSLGICACLTDVCRRGSAAGGFPTNNKHYDGGCRAARDPDDAIPTNGRGRRQMRVKLDLGRKALSHHQPPRGCRRDSSARTECRPAELPGYWSCAANCLLLRQKLALCAGCRRWRAGEGRVQETHESCSVKWWAALTHREGARQRLAGAGFQ